MRNKGRQMDFIGLTGTMLSNEAALSLVDALNSLPPRKSRDEQERLEILQVPFSEAVRQPLKEAAVRAGIQLLLSKANGPALRNGMRACF
jgi:hypothetical protein